MVELVLQRDVRSEKTRAQELHSHVQKLPFTFSDLLILAIVTALLALPMLMHGPLVSAHDATEHLNYSLHFAHQFWRGDWCPRWLLGINHGLGSPN